jgi:transcriptional regulator with XRE-family HTH domain
LVGHAILKKRTELNLTKNDFAKHVGVSITSITLWKAKGNTVITPNATSLNKLKVIW